MNAKPAKEDIKNTLKNSGVRPTRQRVTVYESILLKRDHPTADEIFTRARKKLPSISFATVYNCLETLTQSSLVKQGLDELVFVELNDQPDPVVPLFVLRP